MPSRKRNKGKARKAANKNVARAVSASVGCSQPESPLDFQLRLLRLNEGLESTDNDGPCRHGLAVNEDCEKFYTAFWEKAYTLLDPSSQASLQSAIDVAQKFAVQKYPGTWNIDVLRRFKKACYCYGVERNIRDVPDTGEHAPLSFVAIVAHHYDNIVKLLDDEPRRSNFDNASSDISDLIGADEHTITSFFRKRINCSCLDAKYKAVKSISRIGRCSNLSSCHVFKKRSELMICSRCRSVHYCSRECQSADWPGHKSICDMAAILKNMCKET